MIVEQLGFAMIPLCSPIACEFTSGTTSGTSGFNLNALVLSMTSAPLETAMGAHSWLTLPPALKKAMSMPRNASGPTASIVSS